MAQGRDVRFDDGAKVSREYLEEWVRQLCGGSTATQNMDTLNAAELTQLVLRFSSSEEAVEVAA